MEWRYRVLRATHEIIVKPSPESQNSFWIKNCTGEDIDNFPQVQLTKLSGVLQIILQQ